jgi:hypothetical protein
MKREHFTLLNIAMFLYPVSVGAIVFVWSKGLIPTSVIVFKFWMFTIYGLWTSLAATYCVLLYVCFSKNVSRRIKQALAFYATGMIFLAVYLNCFAPQY